MWSWIALALFAGAMVPFQAAANARIGMVAGHPAWGALVNVLGTLSVLVVYLLALRPGNPAALQGEALPWWAWLGGAFGVVYLVSLTALLPRLGAATLLGLLVLGQLLVASALEHFGGLGVPVHPLGFGRIAGLLLIVLGVVLVRRF
jgi:bacterial/archaeal transporter family-2 protein